MKKIAVLNTWVTSLNVGDAIIMEACKKEIEKLFPEEFYVEFPTHEKISNYSYEILDKVDYKIICGTNLLRDNQNRHRVWNMGLKDTLFLKDIILLGVGANRYSNGVDFLTKLFWRRILNKNVLHSVRDEYTKQMLNSMGINNVIVTSCATMWGLTKEHCLEIPRKKGDIVVTTLTDYSKDVLNDRKMLDILIKNYKKVYYWPQGIEDYNYLEELGYLDRVSVVGANLNSYEKLLRENDRIDFVGTRLHGGIKALQNKKRTVIISIDNRAEEKKKYGLITLKREKIDDLENIINDEWETTINLPLEEINQWKKSILEEEKLEITPNKNLIYRRKIIKFFKIPIRLLYRIFIRPILKLKNKQKVK